MSRNERLGSCCGLMLTVCTVAPCAVAITQAQDLPVVTISGGFARVGDEALYLHGFYLEGERHLTPRLSVLGQGHRATAGQDGYLGTNDWIDVFAGGGIRFTMRPGRLVRPHVHGLAGVYQVSNEQTIAVPGFPGLSGSNTDTSMVFVLGGGVNIMQASRVGIRVDLDLQVFTDDVIPTGRLTAGVVLPIGRR